MDNTAERSPSPTSSVWSLSTLNSDLDTDTQTNEQSSQKTNTDKRHECKSKTLNIMGMIDMMASQTSRIKGPVDPDRLNELMDNIKPLVDFMDCLFKCRVCYREMFHRSAVQMLCVKMVDIAYQLCMPELDAESNQKVRDQAVRIRSYIDEITEVLLSYAEDEDEEEEFLEMRDDTMQFFELILDQQMLF